MSKKKVCGNFLAICEKHYNFAENSLPDCQKLHKKLQEVVDGDSSFFYPERIKSEGLLSIDLIFVLNGGSDRVAANGDK